MPPMAARPPAAAIWAAKPPDKNRRNHANGARKASATSVRARTIKASSDIALPRSEAGEAGFLIGGIRSSGIRAKNQVTSTPVDPEPSAEERKRAWQPPVIDTSRFDGNRSSRHSSTPSDRTAEVEGWHGKTKKRRVKKEALEGQELCWQQHDTSSTHHRNRNPIPYDPAHRRRVQVPRQRIPHLGRQTRMEGLEQALAEKDGGLPSRRGTSTGARLTR